MRKRAIICACLVALIAILLALCLGGCASKQSDVQFIWHDGQCMLFVDGITVQSAQELKKDWVFEECAVEVKSEMGQGGEDP